MKSEGAVVELPQAARATPSAADAVFRLRAGCSIQPFDVGTRHAAWLVIAPNGTRFQTGRGLKDILELIDGRRTLGEICELLSLRSGQLVDPEVIASTILATARAAGLLGLDEEVGDEGAASLTKPRARGPRLDLNPLTMNPLRMTIPVLPQRFIAPMSRVGAALFRPTAFTLGWIVIAVAFAFLLRDYGQYAADVRANRITGYQYGIAYLLAMFSVLVHELGHASAAKRFGAETGTIGVGLYLVFPAFFADVSDVWRLKSRQRLLVDIGGVYFQLLVGVAYYLAYLQSGQRVFVWALLAIVVMVVFSLNPLFKFDGYWMVSDALGIPNLRRRAGDALSAFIHDMFAPAEARGPRSPLLSMGRTRYGFFFGYAIISQVFLIAILYFIVKLFPFIVLDYPAFLVESLRTGWDALSVGDAQGVGSKAFALFFRTLFLLGLVLTVQRWGANTARMLGRTVGNLRAMSPRLRFRAWLERGRVERSAQPARRQLASYALLAVTGLLVAFSGLYSSVVVHELLHLVAGWMAGGAPVAISCQPVGRSVTYVLFEPGASRLVLAIYWLIGAGGTAALGLYGLLAAARWSSGLAPLAAAGMSACLLLASLGYLLIGALEGSGDAGRLIADVGMPALGIIFLLGTCLFLALLLTGRVLLEKLSTLVRVDGALDRLLALGSFIVLPMLALSVVLGTQVPGAAASMPWPEIAALCAVTCFWAIAFRARTKLVDALDPRPLVAICAVSGAALAVWLGAFPPERPFFHLATPPEHQVQAVNLELDVDEGGGLRAVIAMQPFPLADSVLWERVRERAPTSWRAYDAFVAELLEGLQAGASWEIERRDHDPERAFFRTRQERGARVVVARARSSATGDELTVRFDDTWLARGAGYVDRLRLQASPGWSLSGVEIEPQRHSGRLVVERGFCVLRNVDEQAPRSVVFTLTRSTSAAEHDDG